MERQNEISEIVDEAEKEYVPVTERLKPFIDVIRHYRRLEDEVIPVRRQ